MSYTPRSQDDSSTSPPMAPRATTKARRASPHQRRRVWATHISSIISAWVGASRRSTTIGAGSVISKANHNAGAAGNINLSAPG